MIDNDKEEITLNGTLDKTNPLSKNVDEYVGLHNPKAFTQVIHSSQNVEITIDRTI